MPEPTPLELQQVRQQLLAEFAAHLPLGQTGSAEQRETDFLSRSLAAFAIRHLAGCSTEEAAAAVVDGSGDAGIDAVFHSPNTDTLWVVQSKFMRSGRGEPDLGSVAKFKTGVEHLLSQEFDAFAGNAAWNAVIPALQALFRRGPLQVRGVLVYSGVNVVSEDRRRMFDAVKRRFPVRDYVDFVCCSLTTVHDWVTGADQRPGVAEAEIVVLDAGWVQEPYETVYGRVAVADMVSLYREHGSRMVAANIRAYKGNTAVNQRIVDTFRAEPHHFFYLNNGLTAYCDHLQVIPADIGNPRRKTVRVRGFSIVNGAQTLGSVARAAAAAGEAEDGYVLLKIVSLARCVDDVDFARRITQSTNFQNQIAPRDFVALDDQQERIASHLRLEGVGYHYKDDADQTTEDASNFTVQEAVLALASLEWDGTGEQDLCAKATGDPAALYSTEAVYAPPHASRYQRLFRPDRSARTVWRAVQTRRVVVRQMKAEGRAAAAGPRKTFFENARAVVLAVIFVRMRPEQSEQLSLTADQLTAITGESIRTAEALWSACEDLGLVSRGVTDGVEAYVTPRHFRAVFSDPADCRRLREATLARLARA
jgi:hypothetical protein